MKRYFTLIILVVAALPVFAAVDGTDLSSNSDLASIAMVVLGVVALVVTRRINQ